MDFLFYLANILVTQVKLGGQKNVIWPKKMLPKGKNMVLYFILQEEYEKI